MGGSSIEAVSYQLSAVSFLARIAPALHFFPVVPGTSPAMTKKGKRLIANG
jgi:hypothetical protein